MVFDSGNDRVILFGGNTLGATQVFYNDTWVYTPDTNTWTQLLIDGPSPRGTHAMAYDPDHGTVLLFGGRTTTRRLDDTWSFDCATETWTEIDTEPSPEGRSDFDMVYDSSRQVFILYGGWGDRTGLQDDTWMFDPETNTWSEFEVEVTPGKMYGQHIEYDPDSDRVILYGGHLRSPISHDYLEEVWFFYPDDASWIKSDTVNTPRGRYWNALGYNIDQSTLAVFSGTYGEGPIDETWFLNMENMEWSQLVSGEFPSKRVISEMVYVDSMKSYLLFGGVNNSYVHFGDTWMLNQKTMQWEELHPIFSSRKAIEETNMIPGFPVAAILAGILYLHSKKKLG